MQFPRANEANRSDRDSIRRVKCLRKHCGYLCSFLSSFFVAYLFIYLVERRLGHVVYLSQNTNTNSIAIQLRVSREIYVFLNDIWCIRVPVLFDTLFTQHTCNFGRDFARRRLITHFFLLAPRRIYPNPRPSADVRTHAGTHEEWARM